MGRSMLILASYLSAIVLFLITWLGILFVVFISVMVYCLFTSENAPEWEETWKDFEDE